MLLLKPQHSEDLGLNGGLSDRSRREETEVPKLLLNRDYTFEVALLFQPFFYFLPLAVRTECGIRSEFLAETFNALQFHTAR